MLVLHHCKAHTASLAPIQQLRSDQVLHLRVLVPHDVLKTLTHFGGTFCLMESPVVKQVAVMALTNEFLGHFVRHSRLQSA